MANKATAQAFFGHDFGTLLHAARQCLTTCHKMEHHKRASLAELHVCMSVPECRRLNFAPLWNSVQRAVQLTSHASSVLRALSLTTWRFPNLYWVCSQHLHVSARRANTCQHHPAPSTRNAHARADLEKQDTRDISRHLETQGQ